MTKKTVGSVTVEWIRDPGKLVAGQWRVSSRFWEVYPTDAELKDLISVALEATAERDVNSSWHEEGVCLCCGHGYETASLSSLGQCPTCGFRGDVMAEGRC